MDESKNSRRAAVISLKPSANWRRPIRLLLADDHVVFRAALRVLLEKQPGVVVVSEAGTGDEAVALARATRPDVILMDLVMPRGSGLEATRRIRALGLGAKVLVLTALSQERQLLDALEAGASGFVEKVGPVQELIHAIRIVTRGRLFFGAQAAKLVVLQRYLRDRRGELAERAPASRSGRGESGQGGGRGATV